MTENCIKCRNHMLALFAVLYKTVSIVSSCIHINLYNFVETLFFTKSLHSVRKLTNLQRIHLYIHTYNEENKIIYTNSNIHTLYVMYETNQKGIVLGLLWMLRVSSTSLTFSNIGMTGRLFMFQMKCWTSQLIYALVHINQAKNKWENADFLHIKTLIILYIWSILCCLLMCIF